MCAVAGEAIILHYVDDVLVCAPNDDLLSHELDLTIDSLVAARVRASGGKDSKDATLEVPGSGDCYHRSKRMTRPQKLVAEFIRKARTQIRELVGCDFECIHIPIEMAPLSNIFEQAKISHQLFHQNAPGLVRQFHLTREQAWAIVATCPSCQQHTLPALSAGVNPMGLNSCEVWQKDMTHIMSSGRKRYVHVSVDTFSGAVYASAHTGEKSSNAMKHLIQAFSFLGIPKSVKTDNGPTYTSKEFRSFLQQWGVEHKTGIPYARRGMEGPTRISKGSSANNISL
ncbi:hypothetical protein DUI87_23699 [Hirundo rustica rustica]|uniref:RNA-directed DNA polymerase n=1 Tax=Hirundo rustica rustica TaxID=333673 RepID=A0A3M0JEU0_HIRRU|nr:hypothetical protein DUI87_23699 [Hirundo rustica rustica]